MHMLGYRIHRHCPVAEVTLVWRLNKTFPLIYLFRNSKILPVGRPLSTTAIGILSKIFPKPSSFVYFVSKDIL